MTLKILGVSGSPVPNSNTDRAVKAILDATGLESEFIKLSEINVKPCRACKQCVPDNICKQDDDFQDLALKVREAEALVIGAYCPYGQIDAFTKAFLERLWSMRHVRSLNEGILGVIVVSGLLPTRSNPLIKILIKIANNLIPINRVAKSIKNGMELDRMEIVGTVKIKGNVPCITCGEGTDCRNSGVPMLFGKGIIASNDLCVKVEDQAKVWNNINRLGKMLNERLSL